MASKMNQNLDERFLRVQKDPRFWEMPEREQKIKIDKRFQSMFHDKRFQVKYTVDKRGRPINQSSSEDLKRFYKVSDSDDEEEDEVSEERKEQTDRKMKTPGVRVVEDEDDDDEEHQSAETGEEEVDDEDEDEGERDEESGSESGVDSDSDSGPDLARGKGNVETSSDEDDEDAVDAILRREEEEIEHDWGELCKDARRSEEVTSRLAVCNMDWDRIKAKDLLALLNSFVPKEGAVLSVKVYPSEFGKERLKAEETQGPLELRALPEDSDHDTEEERVYRERMRDYQFKRLKYFYAVAECDSVDTATKIYDECDGYEYESSCSVIDLRFIPDHVQFDEEPADVATDVNLSTFTPKMFTSAATTTSKVQLTWDETDHDRVTAMNRKFNKDELLSMDFNAYLASSSEEEEEDDVVEQTEETISEGLRNCPTEEEEEEKKKKKKKNKQQSERQISKYRELLRGIQDKEKKEDRDMEMEVTWVPGLRETTEQLVRKKLEGKDKLTPWEEFLEKKKKKKKKKKETQREEESSDEDLPPDVDLSDPFFTEELQTEDLKKKGRGQKKRTEDEEQTAEEEEELKRQKAEMALLMGDEGDQVQHQHFNYEKIVEQQNLSVRKKKKLLKRGDQPLEEDHFQVDVKDPRFQAMFTSHLFNLDPSHPSYKKTKGTQSILSEKQRRREEEQRRRGEEQRCRGEEQRCRGEEQLRHQKAALMTEEGAARKQKEAGKKRGRDSDALTAEAVPKKPMDPGLSLLVKSIKSKTERFQARKKNKV